MDLVRFVDSIVASPTVRLDLNDETSWWVKSLNAPPPRLRRAMSSNAMRDGAFVSSSQYEARTLTIELDLRSASQDANATELQKLARELDRADNFLMYQPTGATKPVFFKLFRSDMSQIENLTGPTAFRRPTIELLAEPFALGLRETLGPYTVNNDPAAGSNGLYFDVTGVIGDVPAPAVYLMPDIASVGLRRYAWLSVRQHGTPSDLVHFAQAESGTLGTDTTNPGGGPDAAMSGAGVNNFVRCTFATATMQTRVTVNPFSAGLTAAAGRYRVLACVRRSDNTSAMQMRLQRNASVSTLPGSTVTLPLTTNRTLVDLGIFAYNQTVDAPIGYSPAAPAGTSTAWAAAIGASRTSGAGTLDIDYVAFLPADEALATVDITADFTADILLDGHDNRAVYCLGDPFAGSSALIVAGHPTSAAPFAITGSVAPVVPNQTNRVFLMQQGTSLAHTKGDAIAVSVNYWPQYLFVRPSAT